MLRRCVLRCARKGASSQSTSAHIQKTVEVETRQEHEVVKTPEEKAEDDKAHDASSWRVAGGIVLAACGIVSLSLITSSPPKRAVPQHHQQQQYQQYQQYQQQQQQQQDFQSSYPQDQSFTPATDTQGNHVEYTIRI